MMFKAVVTRAGGATASKLFIDITRVEVVKKANGSWVGSVTVLAYAAADAVEPVLRFTVDNLAATDLGGVAAASIEAAVREYAYFSQVEDV